MALGVVCALAPAQRARGASSERENVRKAMDTLLSQPPLLGARASVEVVSLDDGEVIYTRGANDALNPASNTKLVTAAAALLRLGPEFRFTTDFLIDKPLDSHGRVRTLYVRGRGDPTWNTERLYGLAAELWHRGVRQVGEIVLDDTYFDSEKWGPGWEQETSDKAYAAPVGALSLNHNAVTIYVSPGARAGQRARVEVEPDADCFVLQNKVTTIREDGHRKLRPHTYGEGERTRIIVDGRLPARSEPVVLSRRVTDPAMYFGQTLRLALKQRRIQVGPRVKPGAVPGSAVLLASYDSDELSEIIRDMNKVSSNFIAEMLVKTLGAEIKGAPGTWPKGIEVTQDLLAELGIARGTYQLKNGSGLNDTNRFSAHQIITLMTAVWKRFRVAADFVSSLGIAARDGTMRQRMEGTDAAGRLRAKTGTLEKVTALSGFVQSVGGDRFAFSVLVNDWSGRPGPVVSSVDRLAGILASSGMSEKDALASLAPVELSVPELKLRVATYAAMSKAHDKKNLSYLRSALRSERDPAVRIMVADALVRSDPEQGGGPLLEAMPLSPEVYARLRAIGRELSLPVPAVSPLLDLAVDGSIEAVGRLLSIAPLARGAQPDDELAKALANGLADVADASPDELVAALRAAPAAQAQSGVELLTQGMLAAEVDPARSAVARLLKESRGADAAQAQSWIAVLERPMESAQPARAADTGAASNAQAAATTKDASTLEGPDASAAVKETSAKDAVAKQSSQGGAASAGSSAPSTGVAAAQADGADAASGTSLPRPAHPITATTLAPVAAAAAEALKPAAGAVGASYAPGHPDWPVTVIPNPAWVPGKARPASSSSASGPAQTAPEKCTGEVAQCGATHDSRPGG
jgi:D-alanyl-D-alanine carboxypeptidase/D-alanyl-D-alanine-endopeptidase (penicillin-binding protein 4)